VTLTGMLVVASRSSSARIALVNAVAAPRSAGSRVASRRRRLLRRSSASRLVRDSFIVKPNELVRERPTSRNNIEMTRQAYGSTASRSSRSRPKRRRGARRRNNQATLQNIRLWDWRALQDTLRQIQEIRTYYDFPTSTSTATRSTARAADDARGARAERRDAAREQPQLDQREADLHARLRRDDEPGERLHAGRAAELLLEQHAGAEHDPGITVTRPEIYFGELTNTDVYVQDAAEGVQLPAGRDQQPDVVRGHGGIALGGFFRRLLIALDRGDLAKLPFSDDVTPTAGC
jgi:uncharacterized membrane protein (UPF0182 family)